MTRRISFTPIVYVLLLMTPVYWLITMSLKTNGEIMGRFTLFPHEPTFSNFALMFSDSAWFIGYVNALIYVVINVLISVTVAGDRARGGALQLEVIEMDGRRIKTLRVHRVEP